MMVLVFTRRNSSGAAVGEVAQHLVARFEFPGTPRSFGSGSGIMPLPAVGVRMHCGNYVDEPVQVSCDFVGNLKHLCEVCRVAWVRSLPDPDHVRVALDVLQERGVVLDEDIVRLMIGKPKEPDEAAPLLAELREAQVQLDRRVRELNEALEAERRTTRAMRQTAAPLAVGTAVRTWPDHTTLINYFPCGGKRGNLEGIVVQARKTLVRVEEEGVVYEVMHRMYPAQNGYYERHELEVVADRHEQEVAELLGSRG